MKIIKIVSDEMGQNSYLVIKDNDAILIDGGVSVGDIREHLKMYMDAPRLLAVLLTHEHFDHISQLDNILNEFGCNGYIHENGKKSLYVENENLSIMSNPFKIKSKKNVKTFKDGEILSFGEISVACHHTPGHSKGSCVFVIEKNMFTGDSVFKVDFGRCDLFGGDQFVQRVSLEKLRTSLIFDIEMFYPGHGATFDSEEMEYNLKNYFGEN